MIDEYPMPDHARHTLGVLIGIRNTHADQFQQDKFFEEIEDILRDRKNAAFAILVAARFVAQAAELDKGITEPRDPETYFRLRLPEYVVDAEPDLAMAFRITTAIMNHDTDTTAALVQVATGNKQRAGNVFSCLVAMLSESHPPL